MRAPFFMTALRLAADNNSLRRELRRVEQDAARTRVERDQARRDCELVALMAKDRKMALEFLRDQHRIQEQL